MFYGEYDHSIDRKGRLILPSRFREIARENNIERFFLTRGLDKCIFMFSEHEWATQEQKFKTMSFTKKESRSFNRMFFAGAADIVPDRQGRFIIPSYLKEFSGIVKDVMVVGVSSRIELWDKKTWEDFYRTTRDSFEQIAENILEIS
ncbi:MAG TPA: division/cell wall cluster transcriptional repressor MraZ [Candidatus Omnitrophota bacterium]|nr:division/cell wall cluster transcriptional repressor MraZ [Candidatus Omnitrophota bacterium]HQL41189.1 division/cell wall cluster transcriptional repressor MraZ [Candidatus Omnitrophota bacterium]